MDVLFGNHFRILRAGMVQSAESAWTVLNFGMPYNIINFGVKADQYGKRANVF